MSEQPPRASGHLPASGESAPHRFDPDPEAPPSAAAGPTPPDFEGADDTRAPGPPADYAMPLDPQERMRGTAAYRLDQAADAARRLGHRTREQGGLAGRAEPIAYKVGDSLQSAASYVRDNDVERMRDDVEDGVRAAPIKSLAIAAFAGFLLGRLLR